jgi:hypothetical protein
MINIICNKTSELEDTIAIAFCGVFYSGYSTAGVSRGYTPTAPPAILLTAARAKGM